MSMILAETSYASLYFELILAAVGIGMSFLFLMLGIVVGTYRERKHLNSLAEREHQFQSFQLHDLKTISGMDTSTAPVMVHGEVVIASDRFKVFVAKFIRLIGGEIGVYSKMMERARREAIMRMIEDANARGYNAVGNVRLEAVDIGGVHNQSQQRSIQCSAMAYGTAYKKL